MSEIDPYKECPLWIVVPYKKWKELEEVMKLDREVQEGDVNLFASIIANSAIAGFIENKRNKHERKKNNGKAHDDI
jgi:hypothetical protein